MAFVRPDTGERLEQGEGGIGVAIQIAKVLERPEAKTLQVIMDQESRQPDGGHRLEIWQIDEVITLLQSIWHALTPLIDERWRLTPASMDFVEKAPNLVHQTPEGPSLGNALAWFHGAVYFLREAQAAEQAVELG